MKKKYTYSIFILCFFVFTILILQYRKPEINLELKMRQGELATTSEWLNTKAAIEGLIYKVRTNPSDKRSMVALGMAYIQESRISGNHSYYDKAALDLFEKVLKKEPEYFEALIGKGTVLLSQHHFTDAIPVAEMARKNNPYSSSVYGLLADAYVETGDYENAILMADKMSATRPDMKSYSRISYLREIYGDYPGAIEAMNMAVDAGLPGLEQTEWCRYQLGHLYENTGDLTKAQYCYDQSIYLRPSFSWSYAGKARIEKSLGNYFKAISYLKQAQVLLADFSFQQELTELYRITNQQDLAAVSARKTIELLGGLNPEESKNYHGHYADKELAYACIDAYDYLNAYKHALIEYNRRPNNIDVNQAMAWINYKLGKYESANGYADAALRTHSKNPLLNYQAGLIKIKNGDKESGEKLIKQALLINPYMSLAMKWEKHPLLALK